MSAIPFDTRFPEISFQGDKSIEFSAEEDKKSLFFWEKFIKYYGSDLTNTKLLKNIITFTSGQKKQNVKGTYDNVTFAVPINKNIMYIPFVLKIERVVVESTNKRAPYGEGNNQKIYDDFNFLVKNCDKNKTTESAAKFMFIIKYISTALAYYHQYIKVKSAFVPYNEFRTDKTDSEKFIPLDCGQVYMQTTLFAQLRSGFNPNKSFSFGNKVGNKIVFTPVDNNLGASGFLKLATPSSLIFQSVIKLQIYSGESIRYTIVMDETQYIRNPNSSTTFEKEVEVDETSDLLDYFKEDNNENSDNESHKEYEQANDNSELSNFANIDISSNNLAAAMNILGN